MADKNAKTPKNVAGKCYVDNTCIGCGLCISLLPACFHEDTEIGMMYVAQQPSTDAEKAAFLEAMQGCPVSAIGEDG